ncbi:DUF3413 domain-containing protein [Pseudoalteromonas ulvae]|uniref:Sulfatase n=1 Tax=Pseudoalteromonas ulvae TaxID=107327 RepID=A0A244CT99_PSEDV|nr:DUF3413 domain-containing protein [Pseudoalteromonas ulvae]OUL58837.1 sulfatase [Pseudoalteromonas ulvae]
MNLSEQSQFASKANQLLSWGHWFTFANIGLALVISLGYLAADTSPTTLMGSIYLVLNWVGHISFLTFMAFVLTIFPLSLVFPYPRHIRGMAAILATLGASLLALDAFIYFNLGYHLSLSALEQIISLTWQTFVQGSLLATFIAGACVFLILAFELIVSNHCWRHLAQLKQISCGKKITAVLVSCFAMSHLLHIWGDANLKFDITKQDNVLPLSYPTTAKSLLAKNDLLDLDLYNQERDLSLSAISQNYQLPDNIPACSASTQKQTAAFLVFETDAQLQQYLIEQAHPYFAIDTFLQPALSQDTLFNLIYGLPAYYKPALMGNQATPAWLDPTLSVSIDGFTDFNYLNTDAPQPTLSFINANAHSQIQADLIFAFSLAPNQARPIHSSTLYVNDNNLPLQSDIVQPMDLLATIVGQLWQCDEVANTTIMGHNLYHAEQETGINYTQGIFVAYKKDRITLIEPDGSFKNISAAQGFALEHRLDVPFLVESIKKLKQFNH